MHACILTLPKRRRRRQCVQMGQEILELINHVDPHVLIRNADMDMHSANQHAPCDPRQISVQLVIAGLVGVMLVFPVGKWMARRRYRGEPMRCGVTRDSASQVTQIDAGLSDSFAHTSANLDLTLSEISS